MAHRVFGSTEHNVPESPTFELTGTFLSSGDVWTEKFVCLPVAPPGVLVDLVGAFREGPNGERILDPSVINQFLSGLMEDESATRFAALIRDKNRVVQLETLGEIVMWLSEEVLDRPSPR